MEKSPSKLISHTLIQTQWRHYDIGGVKGNYTSNPQESSDLATFEYMSCDLD